MAHNEVTTAPAALREGLAAQEFFPVFQPMIATESVTIAALETLARWRRGGHILVPAQFFHEHMNGDLARAIDHQIHDQAFRSFARWSERPASLRLSVNLSEAIMSNPVAVDQWMTTVVPSSLDPRQITVELLETIAVTPIIHQTLRTLKSAGFRLSLDDFGVGQAGLGLLSAHRFDEIKIDRSLTAQIATARGAALIARLTRIAHDLNTMVVAEGIETVVQWERCHDLAIDVVQGFYFSSGLEWAALPDYFRTVASYAPLHPVESSSYREEG